MMDVPVTIRYFDGCPSWQRARERLLEAARDADVGLVLKLERVETHEDAVRTSFAGSPTLLINGADPFAPDLPTVGLSCRVYQTSDGLEGSPSVAQLRDALADNSGNA